MPRFIASCRRTKNSTTPPSSPSPARAVKMAYQHYRNTSIGISLQDSLDVLIQEDQLSTDLAMTIMKQFDKSINNALAQRVKSRLNFKGKLEVYRFCDSVWTLVVKDAEFKENHTVMKIDKLKVVACDANGHNLSPKDQVDAALAGESTNNSARGSRD